MSLDLTVLHIYTIHMSVLSTKPLSTPAMTAAAVFISGILIGSIWSISPMNAFILLAIGITALFIFRGSARPGDILTLALLTAGGVFSVTMQRIVDKPLILPGHVINHQIRAAGTITGLPTSMGGRTTFLLRCRYINHDGSVFQVRGLLPCTIYGTTSPLDDGDRVIVHGRIRKMLKPVRSSFRKALSRSRHNENEYRLTGGSAGNAVEPVTDGLSLFGGIRRKAAELIDRHRFNGHSGLVKAMIIGDRSGLTREMRISFAAAGIAHILAVSGLHAGILLLALNQLFSLAGMQPRSRFILMTLLMIGYAGICGFRPPVTRTAIMAGLVMGGTLLQRLKNSENIIFATLLAMTAFNPRAIFGASLQLSFAAVWAISTFAPPMMTRIKKLSPDAGKAGRIKRFLFSVAGISCIAYIATAPIAAWHFGSLPLLSIPVNVIAVPLAGIFVLMGLISIPLIALGGAAAPLAAVWTTLTGYVATALNLLANFIASLPFASIDVGSGALFTGTALAVWLYVLSRSYGRPLFLKLLLYIPLCGMLILVWQPLTGQTGSTMDSGSVVFFDVGQGDSALIETSSGQYFLVDTGAGFATRSVVLPSLRSMGIGRLDGLFLSHLHDDHVGGLPDLLEHIEVDLIFCRPDIADSLSTVVGKRVTSVAAGDSIVFTGGGFAVLSPLLSASPHATHFLASENDKSLLVRCSLGASSVLFPGDLSGDAQDILAAWGPALRSSVMKAPHHGAGNINRGFIESTAPDLTVISCGLNNRFGHPAQGTIDLFCQSGIQILRTDHEGSIPIQLPSLKIIP